RLFGRVLTKATVARPQTSEALAVAVCLLAHSCSWRPGHRQVDSSSKRRARAGSLSRLLSNGCPCRRPQGDFENSALTSVTVLLTRTFIRSATPRLLSNLRSMVRRQVFCNDSNLAGYRGWPPRTGGPGNRRPLDQIQLVERTCGSR